MTSKDEPLLRRECDHCYLKKEVDDLKGWLKALIILGITQLCAIIGGMAVIIFKMLPAFVNSASALAAIK